MSKEPVKLGLIGIPVPISRIGVDTAEKIAAGLGMETVDKEFIPPTTADYTPFANKIKGAGANWGYAYAPWPAEAKTFEALRRLGWTGSYMAYGHIQAEDELARIADPGLNVFMANSMFLEGGAGVPGDPRRRRGRQSIRSRRPTAPRAGSPDWCSSRS